MRHLDMLRHQQRTGLSLVEVLISIFILAVGVLSIASLLPLGQNQVALAETQERATQAGLNAFKAFRTRGFSNYQWWRTANGQSIAQANNPPTAVLNQPIIFDPLLIAAKGNDVKDFPHNNLATAETGTQTISRLTFKTAPSTAAGTQLSLAIAEGIFISRDDKILDDRAQPEDPAKFYMNGGIIDYEGRFSWIAMLAPAYPDFRIPGLQVGVPTTDFPCELSVIVLDRRPYIQPPPPADQKLILYDDQTVDGQTIPRERGVAVTGFDGGGISGGEITIRHSTPSYLLVKPGEYLMLLSNDKKHARWYRITGADKFDTTQNTRQITIAGPDWTWPTNGVTAVLVDGAVGVYTKSIKLEGPSPYN